MIILKNNLEAYLYNPNRLSIKNVVGEIDLSDSKWDFLFDYVLKTTKNFYFLGDRLEYSDYKLNNCISFLSESNIRGDRDYYKVFFKLRPANLIVNRKRLSELWSYYEYPAIIFIEKDIETSQLMWLFDSNVTYEEMVGTVSKMYLFHKNFEYNVIWVEQSSDLPEIHYLLNNAE